MLVITLVVVLVFGCKIDAEKSLNLKMVRSDRFISRNRRDAQNFFDQIAAAAAYDDGCDYSGCQSLVVPNLCDVFCNPDTDLAQQVIDSAAKCVSMTPCSKRLDRWELSRIEIPLGVEGYDGQCTLSGNKVIGTGGLSGVYSKPEIYEYFLPIYPAYKFKPSVTLTYEGLQIKCSSCNSSSKRGTNILTSILYFVLCLLNNLLSLGTLNGFCSDDVGGSSGSSESDFTASVTITQTNDFSFVNIFFNDLSFVEEFSTTAFVDLGSNVPAKYQVPVRAAIEAQVKDYDLVGGVSFNYTYTMIMAMYAMYDTNCPPENC